LIFKNTTIINNTSEKTIAQMIVDLERLVAYVWLLREEEKGWVEYKIDFIDSE